jgi:hypothetical protein
MDSEENAFADGTQLDWQEVNMEVSLLAHAASSDSTARVIGILLAVQAAVDAPVVVAEESLAMTIWTPDPRVRKWMSHDWMVELKAQ